MNRKYKRRKLRPAGVLVILLFFLVLVCIGLGTYLFLHPIKLKETSLVVPYQERFDPLDNIEFVLFGNKEDIQIESDVDAQTLGTYTCTYIYKGKKVMAKVEVKDIQPPVMHVKEMISTDTVEEVSAEMFVESVEDQTEVTFSFKHVPDKEEGVQKVLLVATDKSGNITEKEASLQRVKDTVPPVITVQGGLTYVVGQQISTEGFAGITDDVDPSPVMDIDMSQVNTSVPGVYTVVITGKDRSGNETKEEVAVTVEGADSPDAKIVYLTFDDGPSENTAKVLDVLQQYGIKATFFVTGNNAGYRENIVRAYQEGHAIGLHSYTHQYASVYSSVDAYFQDLSQVKDMVEQLTGKRSDLIRFPGGSSNTVSASYTPGIMSQLVHLVRNKGYQYFDWNCSSSDAAGDNVPVQQIIDYATSSTSQYVVVLFHDSQGKGTTPEALPSVIEHYRSQGYIFMPLDVNSYGAHHGVNN